MQIKNKILSRILLVIVAFVLALAGCGVAEDLNGKLQMRQKFAPSSTPASSESEQQDAPVLSEIRLYPAVGAIYTAVSDRMLEYATENHKRIFDNQVLYLSENEVKSTNIILPTGHTLYEDKKGYFIFSGENAVYVRSDLKVSLEDPDNPLYDTRGLLHDWLVLNGDSLYDENGVLVAFEDAVGFTPAVTLPLNYNSLILNAYDATELLDSNSLTVVLSPWGVSTLSDAKKLYSSAEEKVMIRSKPYVAVVQTDALTIYFNGDDGFLIDIHSFALPRKQAEQGTPSILDYSQLATLAENLYTDKLNEMELAPKFEVTDLIAGKPVTVYNPYSAKIEAVTPIGLDSEQNLTLSLDALRVLYGVQLMIDPDTDSLRLYTDPLYRDLVEHILGNDPTNLSVRYVNEALVDETFLRQQEERKASSGYLTTLATTDTQPGVPKPVIRSPRSGQFVYPGSSTKIWVSYYKGKGEPVSLCPTIDGDWVWNDATGFWEGVSPLSGKMVVWHPSYAAAFTIR